MKYIVYVIQSIKTGRRYIGYTSDIDKRIKEHNQGINISTRNKGPWKLIYQESGFTSRTTALQREKEIKKMKGGIQFKKLLEACLNN